MTEAVAPEGYVFDQLIVNEYQPAQGIRPHVDRKNIFDAGALSRGVCVCVCVCVCV